MDDIKIKQPIRKCWQNNLKGSVFVTLPKELGFRDGDFIVFRVERSKITIKGVST